jgi:exodeoxyribonuclease V alpha subunit
MAEGMPAGRLLCELPGVTADAEARLALRLLAEAMEAGDTCLDLQALAGSEVAGRRLPELAAWRQSLHASGLVGDDAAAGLPLVLAGDLLASRRYWCYERELAVALRARAGEVSRLAALQADAAVGEDLRRLFPADPAALVDGVDWQRLAACCALAHGLSLICGGPGTGKTTVAARVIAIAERMRARSGGTLAVQIAAPTGKAAQRLRESLLGSGRRLVAEGLLDEDQLVRLGGRVSTLHRLLSARDLSTLDLLVIDELSMADAATLSRVLARLPSSTQILLLGDHRQLASVAAGHVLGELARFADVRVAPALRDWYLTCGGEPALAAAEGLPALAQAQVELRRNWRSAASPAVSALAAAIQEGGAALPELLADRACAPTTDGQGSWIERRDCQEVRSLSAALWDDMQTWMQAVVTADGPAAALDAFARRRLLCARRTGPFGVSGLNAALEERLARCGLVHRRDDGHFQGRPLLMTRNDYDLELFNGDIGVVWDGQVCFPDDRGGLRQVRLDRLDALEPVWAMTIHKSQGSQFDQVDIVLDADDAGPGGRLLTRELVYTAVTRAERAARLWADEALLQRALARQSSRRSGLGRFLTDD